MSRAAAAIVLVGLCVLSLQAQEWPQFRGPTGQGIADGSGVPVEWDAAKNVAWKAAVPGRGWSSPVVAHGRIWLTSAVTAGRDVSLRLLSFDAESGRPAQNVEVFRKRGGELLNAKNSHASPTPIVDAGRVYVHFGSEGTAALSLDGAIQWKARYACETQHGNGGSPVAYADLVILTCDGFDAAYVAAVDARTGKERWKTWRRQPWSQAYATPLVIRVGDADQIVSPAAHYAAAYEPATGREIWRVRYDDGFSNVPRPVFARGLVFIATGFQQPSLLAVRPDGKGDVTRDRIAWRLARGVPLTPSPIAVDDLLYLVNDAGILSCVESETGAIVWQQRVGGNYSASPVLAGGLVYLQSEEGVTTVFRPGRSFQAVAVNHLDGPMLASMAVAGGSLYIRAGDHLYRISNAPSHANAPPQTNSPPQRTLWTLRFNPVRQTLLSAASSVVESF
jgi:outer membrane protein assembly factor BamB